MKLYSTIVAITGGIGSGKSTFGKAILNVLKLTAPDVRVSGEVWLKEGNDYNLVCDNFSVHKSSQTTKFVEENLINVSYLPSNTTPLFQPLDVGINKIFKERVYKIINSEGNRNKKNYRQQSISREGSKRAPPCLQFDCVLLIKSDLFEILALIKPLKSILLILVFRPTLLLDW